MQDRRMIAEVVPPGCCDMENVSGSRMATPFAPPRPGSTPMMMPRITPTNIRSRLKGDSATPNPCSNALISSTGSAPISAQTQRSFQRSLGQGNREPDLEREEEGHHYAHRHGDDQEPGVLAQPAHEVGDEQYRGDVKAQIGDHG